MLLRSEGRRGKTQRVTIGRRPGGNSVLQHSVVEKRQSDLVCMLNVFSSFRANHGSPQLDAALHGALSCRRRRSGGEGTPGNASYLSDP